MHMYVCKTSCDFITSKVAQFASFRHQQVLILFLKSMLYLELEDLI